MFADWRRVPSNDTIDDRTCYVILSSLRFPVHVVDRNRNVNGVPRRNRRARKYSPVFTLAGSELATRKRVNRPELYDRPMDCPRAYICIYVFVRSESFCPVLFSFLSENGSNGFPVALSAYFICLRSFFRKPRAADVRPSRVPEFPFPYGRLGTCATRDTKNMPVTASPQPGDFQKYARK